MFGFDPSPRGVRSKISRYLTCPRTAKALSKAKIKVTKVFKIHEGRPNVLDRIKNGDINFIINTPSGKIPREHEVVIRNAALAAKIPIMTTVRAALASANGIRSLQKRKVQVRSLQEYNLSVIPSRARDLAKTR